MAELRMVLVAIGCGVYDTAGCCGAVSGWSCGMSTNRFTRHIR